VRNAFESLADMPAGGRQVSLATARASADEVEIRVTDSGPGISPEIADRLFHPFATTKKSGTGLGLAMSRTIVQSHGGNIIAEPASPRGARLIVRLPAVEEDAGDDEERNRDGGR
jgi:two-component system, LuxR family, sensor kinase FixL